ncbi:MAG: DUF285 domain-containing protein, partial [Proteobacteria bacterium]|nr:DUF285 domain-containing protein [Pseudomonadota bacterium]
GACICPNTCIHGCNTDGSCRTTECKNGNDNTGACICPDTCTQGCNPDGSCRTIECKNGNDNTGACICPDTCVNGCYINGACKCDTNICIYGCDESGNCKCDDCKNNTSCDLRTGKCACPAECPDECKDDGSCNDLCGTKRCAPDQYCDSEKKCQPLDVNKNHMIDTYETAAKKGSGCVTDRNCDSISGAGDGFCDSFLDYTCSTRCTSDDQCIDDKLYHYVCRKDDGRCAPDTFITVWDIPQNKKTLTIPLYTNHCDIQIDWGDNIQEPSDCATQLLFHSYENSGLYTVKIKGKVRIGHKSPKNGIDYLPTIHEDASKLVEVKTFGPVSLGPEAFAFCSQLKNISEVDIPNAAELTDMQYFFYKAEEFNAPIQRWDTSNVKNMHGLFMEAGKFNQPLGKWNTSNVTDMSSMFYFAKTFNQPIKNWKTSNVTDMSAMFSNADAFDQPIENWSTIKVTDMHSMFFGALIFNQPIGKWNTSNVTDMHEMFRDAEFFNHPLDDWDTSKVTDMSTMFCNATAFNHPLNTWNTSNVTDMEAMFEIAKSFNQPLDRWNTAKVTSMTQMFTDAKRFNQDLSSWVVQKHTSVEDMFDCTSLSSDNFNKIQESPTWEAKPQKSEFVACREDDQ